MNGMRSGKKILAIALVFCMVVVNGVWPAGKEKVHAAVSGDYEYVDAGDGTVCITKYKGTDTEVTVPEQVDNKVVTRIGNEAFFSCQSLTKVTLPTGIISIEDGAFRSCTGLVQILLPAGLTSLGDGAFKDCTGLTEMNLPADLTDIGFSAFRGCTSLTQINLPLGITSINDGVFADCIGLKKMSLPPDVTGIEDGAFTGCSHLTEINLPVALNRIGDAAFQNCTGLTDVYYDGSKDQWSQIQIGSDNVDLQNAEIHFKVNSGGSNEFYEYMQKSDGTIEITKYKGTDTKVEVPEQIDGKAVSGIGESAFAGCMDVTDITIPASVTGIKSNAFLGCSSLAYVYYADTERRWNEIEIESAGNENLLNSAKYFTSNDYEYRSVDENTVSIARYKGKEAVVNIPAEIDGKKITAIDTAAFSEYKDLREISMPDSITNLGHRVFYRCENLTKIVISPNVTYIGQGCFQGCSSLEEIRIPDSVIRTGTSVFEECTSLKKITISSNLNLISQNVFMNCRNLEEIRIPESIGAIAPFAFLNCSSLKDVYYSGSKEQWEKIKIGDLNEALLNATIHFKEDTKLQPPQEEKPLPGTIDAKEELQRLKVGDPFLLNQDFQYYLSDEQIDVIESFLFTWLAEINYAFHYSGYAGVKELVMKKVGIDPHGDFASGREQAVTHLCADTKYGPRIFCITLDLGKPDGSGNLYPSYGAMHYEVLEKGSIPSELPKSGRIGKESYTDLGTFVQCVSKAAEDSLHGTYRWETLRETLSDKIISGVLVDKTVTEIIGNKYGSFSDAILTVYAKPLFSYSKKVTIACPVDVRIYGMDGREAGSIINNQPSGGSENVRLDVNGDTKTVYLTGNDYYLNLRGTGTGTMRYEVEEIANEEVRRNVQFLELQLQEDMQYEGYVFRPLNIDNDLYALRTKSDSWEKIYYSDSDSYKAMFKRVQGLSLSQDKTSLDRDKTVQLSASMLPLDASNPNLQWTTDKESVVKVDSNGLVTAVGSGRATVTVSTKDGSFLKQYCVIDVADKMNGSGGSGSSSGSSGWNGGGVTTPVEQDRNPVVVNLHYVLQFHANGGTGLSRKTMTLLADDSPGIMPKVQRKDYLFEGWYTQQDGGEKITGEKPLKEAATLYAKWVKVSSPAKAAVEVIKSKKKGQMQVRFQSIHGVSGYQIEYALDKKFSEAKTKEAGKTAKSKTISGLKAGKLYYVRVRAYHLDSMKNRIYGAYSTVKSIKIKH